MIGEVGVELAGGERGVAVAGSGKVAVDRYASLVQLPLSVASGGR